MVLFPNISNSLKIVGESNETADFLAMITTSKDFGKDSHFRLKASFTSLLILLRLTELPRRFVVVMPIRVNWSEFGRESAIKARD
jgi:hypothetical protein